jgi:branched-chain amino acid transport system substrate-binding protein
VIKKIFLYSIVLIKTIFYINSVNAKVVSNKIFIGTTFSLSGKYEDESVLLKNNYIREIEQINKTGGIKIGSKIYKIDIIFYDNLSNNGRNNILLKRLILNDGVEFLIGTNNFELSDEVVSLLEKNQISIVTSNEAISVYKNMFEKINTIDSKKIRSHLLNNQ